MFPLNPPVWFHFKMNYTVGVHQQYSVTTASDWSFYTEYFWQTEYFDHVVLRAGCDAAADALNVSCGAPCHLVDSLKWSFLIIKSFGYSSLDSAQIPPLNITAM